MRARLVVACSALMLGCVGDTVPTPDGGDAGAETGTDAPANDVVDAGACDPSKPFGAAVAVPGIALTDGGATENTFATLTGDQLQIVFASNRVSGNVNYDLFFAQRTDATQPFGSAAPLTVLNDTGDQRGAAFSADGLTLFYYSNGNIASYDVFSSTRANVSSTTFASPNPVTGVNTGNSEFDPHPTADASALYFVSKTTTGSRIFRALASSNFTSPSPIPELDSANGSVSPVPTSDDLGLYFAKIDPGGDTIWLASRTSKNAAYSDIHAVAELGAGARPSWLSPDACTIYFWTSGAQTRPVSQLYVATKPK
jgi:hypothetical protein